MNFEPSEDQLMIVESFGRFLDANSSPARVRAALPTGFDPELWRGIAALGGFGMRVPEAAGGLGLGLLDTVLVMEEMGRALASGPVAETIVAARLLAEAGELDLVNAVLDGNKIATIALHDIAERPAQWVAGGAVADIVLGREGGGVYLIQPTAEERHAGPNLASTPIAEIRLDREDRRKLTGNLGAAFAQGLEEWKLLTAATLVGLSHQAIKLASAYASERLQFGEFIGTYQAISHPLAEHYVASEGGRYLIWKTIRDIHDGATDAATEIPLCLWWASQTATLAVAQALHSFGGYGLTTDYDIHLYNLRAKAIPLILGDPQLLLDEAANRRYENAAAEPPDVGEVTIDFDLGEDAAALAEETDQFFRDTLTPELKAKAHYSFAGHDPGVHKKLAEARLLFPNWSAEMGGRGSSKYAAAAAFAKWEEHNWSGHAMATTRMVGTIISMFGSGELKRDVLGKIIKGEAICSLGYSEPHAGSDAFAAKTRATKIGNEWHIDGQKMFTSGANIADYVMLLTRTDFDVPKHKGLTMFIVPLNSKGITIQAVHTFQDERTNITFYDNVVVPDSYRLGEVNGGGKVTAAGLTLEHGGGFLSSQNRMLHEAENFCRETKRAGRPMIEQPQVKARLIKVFAHNALTYVIGNLVAWAHTNKKHHIVGSMSKLFSSESFRIDAADLLDLTAPESLASQSPSAAFLNLSYRHSQGTTIYGGTSEIHRSQIAERALKLPRSRR